MPKRALVLSGGGAKGSFQIGVLEQLLFTHRLDFQIFCGVSVGALNAAYLAQAPSGATAEESLRNLQETFRDLRKLWLEEITGNRSIFTTRGGDVAAALGADSIHDAAPLRDLIWTHLSPQKLAASKRILRLGVVTLEDGKYDTKLDVTLDVQHVRQFVLASATMPYYFEPVEARGRHMVDGGVRNITPLSEAFAEKPDEIYVIYASPFHLEEETYRDNSLGTKVNAFTYLKRTVEILINEVYRNDVEGAKQLNTVLRHWNALRPTLTPGDPHAREIDAILGKKHYAPLYEFKPEHPVIRDALEFDPAKIRENYEYGRRIGAALPSPS